MWDLFHHSLASNNNSLPLPALFTCTVYPHLNFFRFYVKDTTNNKHNLQKCCDIFRRYIFQPNDVSKTLFLFPLNVHFGDKGVNNNHWILMVIETNSKTWTVLDSKNQHTSYPLCKEVTTKYFHHFTHIRFQMY